MRDELRVYKISDSHWTGISCSCCNGERARRKGKGKKMDAETLADINKLDAVVRQLGIGESFEEPADAVAKLQDRYSAACLMRDALKTENESLRGKIADVHSLMCEASAMLAGITAGARVDVDGAFNNIQLAIRRAA